VKTYPFRVDMSVRDYECDMQGIVNNSVYQNYLEHARHMFLKEAGINFKEYTDRGINLVVVRAELIYRCPLVSGDSFWIGVGIVRESRLKIVFYQDIYRVPDDRPILDARITGTAINSEGKPEIPEALAAALEYAGAGHPNRRAPEKRSDH